MQSPIDHSKNIWSLDASSCFSNSKHRSLSVSEDVASMSGLFSIQRARFQSQPVGEKFSEPNITLNAVEDVFINPSAPKSRFDSNDFLSHVSSTEMPSTSPKPAIQRAASTGGWLEVSIDSTLPASPVGISKNAFDLSHLEKHLPKWKPASKFSIDSTPPSAARSSLIKRLLPDPSTLKVETYSRKVFIGGLPPDIDQEEIRTSFEQYGPLTIDWPHKIHSKSNVPPKGYAFLLFKEEHSVHKLLSNCISEGEKLFTFVRYVTSGIVTRKKVQIRPWRVSNSYFMANSSFEGDSRNAVFVGGVPRPLKASELADVMLEKFGAVTFIAIDCDSDLKYPKGAACVIFATHTSYIAAVSSRFMQLVFGSIEKKVELKPYILDDQLCDECDGIQSNGQPAPFFCGSVTCLRYYCEHCWATFHSLPGRHNHRPMFKDIFDREKFC